MSACEEVVESGWTNLVHGAGHLSSPGLFPTWSGQKKWPFLGFQSALTKCPGILYNQKCLDTSSCARTAPPECVPRQASGIARGEEEGRDVHPAGALGGREGPVIHRHVGGPAHHRAGAGRGCGVGRGVRRVHRRCVLSVRLAVGVRALWVCAPECQHRVRRCRAVILAKAPSSTEENTIPASRPCHHKVTTTHGLAKDHNRNERLSNKSPNIKPQPIFRPNQKIFLSFFLSSSKHGAALGQGRHWSNFSNLGQNCAWCKELEVRNGDVILTIVGGSQSSGGHPKS